MALTDSAIRALKPRDSAYKVADVKGLYLMVTPAGGKLWKLKFRNGAGIEKELSLGAYPAALAEGADPAEKKQSDKRAAKINAENTFSAVAKAYIEKNRSDGKADATVSKREWFLGIVERPPGNRPIADILPYEILDAVRPFERAKNHEKAHRTLQFIGQVCRFAVANQLALRDPARDLRGALVNHKPKHLAAILEPKRVGELLRAIDDRNTPDTSTSTNRFSQRHEIGYRSTWLSRGAVRINRGTFFDPVRNSLCQLS